MPCSIDAASLASISSTPPNVTATTSPNASSATPSDGDREQWILATKFGHHYHGFQNRTQIYDPADVRQQLEASLKALQTDYVDLYQFHSGKNDEFDTPGLWEMLNDQVKAGKVRHLGISVSPNDNLFQVDRASEKGCRKRCRWFTIASIASPSRAAQSCHRQGLGVLARVPLASGYLSGKYNPGATFAEGRVPPRRSPKDRREPAKGGADPRDRSPARAWTWPSGPWPGACSTKPSARDPRLQERRQVESNAAAANLVRDDHPLAAAGAKQR